MVNTTASDTTEPTPCTYSSQGLTLHYADWGNESAPLLVLLHGVRDHARSWDWTARALKDHWHVIVPDLRGHGDSAWSPEGAYLNPYHLLDFVKLMEILSHDKVTMIGHSFGAGIASRYSALYPDRVTKLAIVDGFGPELQIYEDWEKAGPTPRMREWINQRRDPRNTSPRRFRSIDEAVSRMAASNPRLSEAQARYLTIHGVRQHPDGYGWKFDPRVSMFTPEDFSLQITTFWREITAPTLLCYGAKSWSTNPEADGRAANLRNHKTKAIEDAGHWPHHDQFDAFMRVLREFL